MMPARSPGGALDLVELGTNLQALNNAPKRGGVNAQGDRCIAHMALSGAKGRDDFSACLIRGGKAKNP
jgi:hypothetical protein